jgi:LysR family hydrogen peroxide-inducible transcriptional activator
MPLVIEENYTARLQERLLQGELDVIIISLPFAEPGLEVRALYDEPFMVVLPAGHSWRERSAIAVKELAEEPVLMLGAGHCFREQVLSVCPDCQRYVASDDPLARAMEGGSLETIRHMVASGLGVTVLPCTAAGADRYAQRLLVLKRFKPPVPKRRVALVWRKGFYRPRAVAALAKAIRACKLSCVEFVGR